MRQRRKLLATTDAGITSAAVFEQYRERVYRYVYRLARNAAEAEDLTQETFLRAHRRLATLRDPAALPSWLYRIATHVCYDRFRQPSHRLGGRALDPDHEDVELPGPSLDQVIERAEMSACVQEFLVALPDQYRMVILLHDVHETTSPEIAAMLGCSLEAVKIRLHRARRKLKAALATGCDFSHDERGVFVCEPKPPSSR